MTSQPHRKFGFDTVFDGAGGVAYTPPPAKRTFTAEDVEAARAEGRAEGERQTRAAAETLHAQALAELARLMQQALPAVAGLVQAHREGAAELALACGKAIADAALARFPEAPMQAALENLAREIDAAPRIVFSLAPELAGPLTPVLEQAAQGVGYGGSVVVRADPHASSAAFTLDFGDGSASFDPQAAAERVRTALTSALAADGGPGDPH
jgi:flagellar assembly protein FliH